MMLLSFILLTFSLPTISSSSLPPPAFSYPRSTALDYTNLLIGNGGDEPNFTGGMIPSVSPPFGMTRWVAQTQVHYVSAVPYNWTLDKVMGFVGTRQPAIWMGESAPISVCPGVGNVVMDFQERGLRIKRSSSGEKREIISVGYYSVDLEDGHGGSILVEQTASKSGTLSVNSTF
jgi:putative alpha-1,2-mannosidase